MLSMMLHLIHIIGEVSSARNCTSIHHIHKCGPRIFGLVTLLSYYQVLQNMLLYLGKFLHLGANNCKVMACSNLRHLYGIL